MRRVYVINGPNLNLLGTREPEVYGGTTLREINRMLKKEARARGMKIGFYQSNHEGNLVDRIQSLPRRGYGGLIINPGALTHYSYAIRDAVAAISPGGVRTVEVHLSDIHGREAFRKKSVIMDVCEAQISGHGPDGYVEALDLLSGMDGRTERVRLNRIIARLSHR